jgi:hypothetical protein
MDRTTMLGMFTLAFAAAGSADAGYVNTTTGKTLSPGVYGRIEVGRAPPPPVIYHQPVVASQAVPPPGVKPVYLYIPPGQARKWPKHCGKYQACELPVLFVRVDDSPSKLGKWKVRDEARLARMQ